MTEVNVTDLSDYELLEICVLLVKFKTNVLKKQEAINETARNLDNVIREKYLPFKQRIIELTSKNKELEKLPSIIFGGC